MPSVQVKNLAICIILFGMVFLSAGCRTGDDDPLTEPSNGVTVSGTTEREISDGERASNAGAWISEVAIERLSWDRIKNECLNEYIPELGKPFLEVRASTYEWFPRGYEIFRDPNAPFFVYYLFSASTWNNDSVAVAVNIPFTFLFGEWDGSNISAEGVETYVGDTISWVGPSETDSPYYVYTEGGVVLKLYSNDAGTKLFPDQYVSLQQKNAQTDNWMRNVDLLETKLSPDARVGSGWETINRHVNDLGMSADVFRGIRTDTVPVGEGADYEVYSNGEGISYNFVNGQCYSIALPTGMVFPDWQGEDVRGDMLLARMNTQATWSRYEGIYKYIYNFNDCTVVIDSDEKRNVFGGGFVTLILNDYSGNG
jgi:hypothetical protein